MDRTQGPKFQVVGSDIIMYLLLSVTLVVCSIGLALGLSSRAEQGVDRRLTSRTSEIESFAYIADMLLQVVMY